MTDLAVDLSSGESFRDGFPHEFFLHLREQAPVFWHEPTANTPDGEGFWVVSRHEDIAGILRAPKLFSSDRGGARTAGGTSLKDERSAGQILNQTDDPHHRRLRELVQKGFTTRAIARLETDLAARTKTLLDTVAGDGVFDVVPTIARELPSQAICMILGVPQSDRAELVEYVDKGIENQQGEIIGHDYLRKLSAYAQTLIAHKRAQRSDDIFSNIVHARLDGYDPPQLSDRELKLFFNLLFPAGAETTRSAIGGAVKAFAEYPEQWRLLRQDRRHLRTAIEEILRWTTPSIYKRRTATENTSVGDVAIGLGEKISVWEMSGNRDWREFDQPFEFDITRKRNRHLSFGAGVHFCLGSQLARLELKVVLEGLLDRYSAFELAGVPQWTPNNRLNGLKSLPVRAIAH